MARIEIVLENRWAYVTKATHDQELLLRDFYSFFFNNARFDRRYKLYMYHKNKALRMGIENPKSLPGWDGRIRLYTEGRLAAGLFRATRNDLKEKGIRFRVVHRKPAMKQLGSLGPVKADKYRFQHECVTAMMDAIPKGGGIILSATGSGKTRMAGWLFKVVPYACLFVVDTLQLLEQSRKEIAKWLGEPVGIVGGQRYDVQRVTVATIQTLSLHVKDRKFLKWYQSVRIMLVDELHEQLSKRQFKVLEQVNPIAVFGLTATLQMKLKPVRFKAWSFCGPVIYDYPLKSASEAGVVVKGAVLQLLFPEVMEYEAKYHDAYKKEVVENPMKMTACKKISTWLTEKRDRYVLMLADRIDHVIRLDERMTAPHYAVRGAVSRADRVKSQTRFEKGVVRLLIASRVFKKGMNITRLDAVVDVAEGNSKNDAAQKYGRGVRLHDGKDFLYYIDFGTQTGRFAKRAMRRRKAFVEAGLKVKTVIVLSSNGALEAVREFVDGIQEETEKDAA